MLDDIYEVGDHVIDRFVGEAGVERQGHLVLIEAVGVGVVLDVEAQGFVGGHQRKRLVVHVGGDVAFGHLLDDAVGLFAGLAQQAHQVEVMGGAVVGPLMVEDCHGQAFQCGVVSFHNLIPAFQQFGVALHLSQSQGGHDVGHVALVPGSYDVVFPGAELGLGQCVLVLPVEGEKLRDAVKQLVPGLALFLRHQ